ncbi:MAG: hypothetical protein ACK5LS_12955 [Propioniciclava sp.]
MRDVRRRSTLFLYAVVGTVCSTRYRRRDERGLSQSTEQAIIIAGAVAVALVIVGFVTNYVNAKLKINP